MKYIRTPLTIFEVVGETNTVYCVRAKGNPNHLYNKSKCQTKVIKEGNSIEELCDEFVVSSCETNAHVSYDNNSRMNFENLKAKVPLEDYKIYGAIWTDKGLIYVAKMNDKGELELL